MLLLLTIHSGSVTIVTGGNKLASENGTPEPKSTTVRISKEIEAALLAAKARYEREIVRFEVTTTDFLGLVVREGLAALGLVTSTEDEAFSGRR